MKFKLSENEKLYAIDIKFIKSPVFKFYEYTGPRWKLNGKFPIDFTEFEFKDIYKPKTKEDYILAYEILKKVITTCEKGRILKVEKKCARLL